MRLLEVQHFTLPGNRTPALDRDSSQCSQMSHKPLLFHWGPTPEAPLALQQPEPALHSQHQTRQLKLPGNMQLPKSDSALMIPLSVAEGLKSHMIAYNTVVLSGRKKHKAHCILQNPWNSLLGSSMVDFILTCLKFE